MNGEDGAQLLFGLPPCDLKANNVSRDALRRRLEPLINDPVTFSLDLCVQAEVGEDGEVRFRIFGTELLPPLPRPNLEPPII